MTKLALIFLGAGLGGVLRYVLGGWVQSWNAASFPTGTLAVNVLGCLAIGFLGAAFLGPLPVREEVRLAVLVGVIGGFTTYSGFALDTLTLHGDRGLWQAGLNLLLMNVLGLAAVWVGLRVSERVFTG